MWQHLAASENHERTHHGNRADCQRLQLTTSHSSHNAEYEGESPHRERQAQQQDMRDEWQYGEEGCVA